MCDDDKKNSAACAPGLFGLISVICALTGAVWCTTFKIKSKDTDSFRDFEFGVFTTQDWYLEGINAQGDLVASYSCVNYPSAADPDTAWKTAAVLQPVTWAVGVVLSCILLFASCGLQLPLSMYRLVGAMFIFVCSLFAGMIYYVYKSKLCRDNPMLNLLMIDEFYDNQCSVAGASGFIIFAIIGFFLTGISSCFLSCADLEGLAEEPEAQAKAEDEAETAAVETAAAADEAPAEETNVEEAASPAEGSGSGEKDEEKAES